MLLLVDWDCVTTLQNSKVACNRVLEIFSGFYDIVFPKQNIKIRDKKLKRSWKSKGLQGCTKRKQKLYLAVLQKETKSMQNDEHYIKHYSKHWRRNLTN